MQAETQDIPATDQHKEYARQQYILNDEYQKLRIQFAWNSLEYWQKELLCKSHIEMFKNFLAEIKKENEQTV